jgi:hypothetical protein
MTAKKKLKTSPKTKIKTTEFQVKILESKELNDLLEKVKEGLSMSSQHLVEGAGDVFSFQEFDSLDWECGNPELQFLEWIQKKKTIFKVGGVFVAASFQKIKDTFLEDLKGIAEDEEFEKQNQIPTLELQIQNLENDLVKKKAELESLKK